MRRLLAAVLIVAALFLCSTFLLWTRSKPPTRDFSGYTAAQLSWVIEGIQEQMSELSDELAKAQEAQRAALANGLY